MFKNQYYKSTFFRFLIITLICALVLLFAFSVNYYIDSDYLTLNNWRDMYFWRVLIYLLIALLFALLGYLLLRSKQRNKAVFKNPHSKSLLFVKALFFIPCVLFSAGFIYMSVISIKDLVSGEKNIRGTIFEIQEYRSRHGNINYVILCSGRNELNANPLSSDKYFQLKYEVRKNPPCTVHVEMIYLPNSREILDSKTIK